MRSRFGRQSGGISFFAFQDIITGTSGFLIVLALFLALNLDEKLTEGTGAEPYAKREEELRSMLAQIVSEKNKVADYQQRPSDDAATLRRMIGQLTSTIAELDAKPLPGMNRDAAEDVTQGVEQQFQAVLIVGVKAAFHGFTEAELLNSTSKSSGITS